MCMQMGKARGFCEFQKHEKNNSNEMGSEGIKEQASQRGL